MLLAAISIPFTYLVTFAFMWLFGFELNMVTLTGVILGVGMLLDDAIVVLENIERHHHQLGKDLREAVVGGTEEVMLAILSGTYATVVVLVPIIFIGGFVQTVLRPLSLTLSIALLASYVVSVTVLPILAPVILRIGGRTERWRWEKALERFVSGKVLGPVQEFFARGVKLALRRPVPFLLVAVLLLAVTGRVLMPLVGRDLDAAHGYGHLPGHLRGIPEHVAVAHGGAPRAGGEGGPGAGWRAPDVRHARVGAWHPLVRLGAQPAAGIRQGAPRRPLPPRPDALAGRGRGPPTASGDPGPTLPGRLRLRCNASLDHPFHGGPDAVGTGPAPSSIASRATSRGGCVPRAACTPSSAPGRSIGRSCASPPRPSR